MVGYRSAVLAMFAAVPLMVGACNKPKPPPDAGSAGKGADVDTRYPGPFDETLSEDQRRLLRERGNMQR